MKLHNLKEKIYQFLEIQDSSKSQFQFLFQGKRDIHFLFGMILSLLLNIASICLSVTLILELMYHSKPTVNYAKFLSSVTKNMTLNTKELLFTIAFRDNNYNLINDPSIGQIIATYEKTTTINGNINIEIINLDFMNCSKVYPLFDKLGVSDRFNSTGLINYNCYNYSEPIIIGGKYGSEFYGNLAFYIKKCQNSSDSNIKCKNEEDIDNLIKNSWLQINFVSSYVNFHNYTNPIQYIIEDSYIKLDNTMNKQLYIYFSALEIYSENNILFSNKNTKKSTKHDITTTDINSVLKDGIISSIMICPSFTVEKFYRKYIKIQEIGATFGGLYSGLGILAVLLSTYHKYKFTEMKIINELFSFGSEKLMSTKHSLFKYYSKKQIIDDNPDIHNTIIFKPIVTDRKKYKINLELPFELEKASSSFYKEKSSKVYYYRIDLGLVRSFKLICCFNQRIKQNLKEYNFVMKELLKYIDYIEVSKYFMDVEKIKSILNKSKISKKWESEKKLIVMNSSITKNNKNMNNMINNYINNHSKIVLNISQNEQDFSK